MNPLKQQSVPKPDAMQLRVLLPARVLVDETVVRIVAEAENGAFGVLPRHIDFLAALNPGVLVFEDPDGNEGFVGHDIGIFVKRGSEVLVSVRNAVRGENLATLRNIIQSEFVTMDQRERMARTALARLEAGVVRRFVELEEKR
jgi:F-type H+-transporting ATPase subunit epsilon